jgi:integrative and conjugative element protein (TIGR02256 family)
MSHFLVLRASYGPIVLMPRKVVSLMRRYQMPTEVHKEAGGIFIGNYRNRHIEVLGCTEPMPEDRRHLYSFDRMDPRHAEYADVLWRKSGRTSTFVGEWHTHPEAHPSPSSIDHSTWNTVIRKCHPMSVIFSICGTTETCFWLGTTSRLQQLKIVYI